jgi:hypothetical protein
MTKRGRWLGFVLLAIAALAFSGPTRTPAQSSVWFRAGFDELGPKNLYNFANRYAQSPTTWQTEHLPAGGWAGSGGAHVRVFGCQKGSADCSTSAHQMNVGWQTPPIGMPLGRPWKLGDQAFIRFRIRFDPDTVFPTDQFGAKFILWGTTRTTPNSRWIIHLMPPYSNQGCTLGFESYSHLGWAPPGHVWRQASDWKLPSFKRDASNEYGGFSSNVNIGWSCMPAILVHGSNRKPVQPQRRGAAPVDGWYHLQFQAVSGEAGQSAFRAWANNNDQASPSSEHVNMRRDSDDGDTGGLGVTGWEQGVYVAGYWGTAYDGAIGFVIDDFEIGAAFDPAWYPTTR